MNWKMLRLIEKYRKKGEYLQKRQKIIDDLRLRKNNKFVI